VQVVRIVKTVMVASLALFALLVAYDNIVDYGSNEQFVRHVLSMDTTFPNNALMTRAVTAPWAWAAAYWLIIGAEGLTGLLFAAGALRMALAIRGSAARFNGAKQIAILGAGIAFLLWFTGFMVVGGEWFAMWQSETWNGQEAAFRFTVTVLAVLVFVNQPDGEAGR
jgi:predicted small integral membrane protein